MGNGSDPDDDPDDGETPPSEPGPPVPEPFQDPVTVDLVRDAIDVARGELSTREFSRKYGTGPDASRAIDEGDGTTDRPDNSDTAPGSDAADDE